MPLETVDLRPIENFFPEYLSQLEDQDLEYLLRGSDLKWDSNEGETVRKGHPWDIIDFKQEGALLRMVRKADRNKDQRLSLNDAYRVVTHPDFQAKFSLKKRIPAEVFMTGFQDFMENRYRPLAHNLKLWQAERQFVPLFRALRIANQDLYQAQRESIKGWFNSPGKAIVNGLTFVVTVGGVLNWLTDRVLGEPSKPVLDDGLEDTDASYLMGDRLAQARPLKRYHERETAINELDHQVRLGIYRKESWAWQGGLQEGLDLIAEEEIEILEEELGIHHLWKIFQSKDRQELYQSALDFTDVEREDGNTSDAHWFNWTGSQNNFPFARSILFFISNQGKLSDETETDEIRGQAGNQLLDSLGNNGSLLNIAGVGTTNVFCLGGWLCTPLAYRDWNDEGDSSAQMGDFSQKLNLHPFPDPTKPEK